MSKKLIIAIDGPAGSGKSTTAKLVAQRLGYVYIDTGAMYRAVTLSAIRKNILDNENEIVKTASALNIILKLVNGETKIEVNGEDVSKEIRSIDVNQNVSPVSKIEGVRKILVKKQQELGRNGGVVMEGRDITTVVFPEADVKVFLTASVDERSKRRKLEFDQKGVNVDIDDVKKNLIQRDSIDSSREISPLKKSPDSIEVDTSNLTIDEQVEIIIKKVENILSRS